MKLLQRTLGKTHRCWALQVTLCYGSLDDSGSQMQLFIAAGVWNLNKKEHWSREKECFLQSGRKDVLTFEGLNQSK